MSHVSLLLVPLCPSNPHPHTGPAHRPPSTAQQRFTMICFEPPLNPRKQKSARHSHHSTCATIPLTQGLPTIRAYATQQRFHDDMLRLMTLNGAWYYAYISSERPFAWLLKVGVQDDVITMYITVMIQSLKIYIYGPDDQPDLGKWHTRIRSK